MSGGGQEIEQAVLRSHCAFDQRGPGHKCQGEVTIREGGVSLACKLCGAGGMGSGPNPYWRAYKRASAVVEAAGIAWASLSAEAQWGAVMEAARERCPGCQMPAPEEPGGQWHECSCRAWVRDGSGWRRRTA